MNQGVVQYHINYITYISNMYSLYSIHNKYIINYISLNDILIIGDFFVKFLITSIQRDYKLLNITQDNGSQTRNAIINNIQIYFQSQNYDINLIFGLFFIYFGIDSIYKIQLYILDNFKETIFESLDVVRPIIYSNYDGVYEINEFLDINQRFQLVNDSVSQKIMINVTNDNPITINYPEYNDDYHLVTKINQYTPDVHSHRLQIVNHPCDNFFIEDNPNVSLRRRILSTSLFNTIIDIFPDYDQLLFLLAFQSPRETNTNSKILLSKKEKALLHKKYGYCPNRIGRTYDYQIIEYYGDIMFNMIIADYGHELKIINFQLLVKYIYTSNDFMGYFTELTGDLCGYESNKIIDTLSVEYETTESWKVCADLLESLIGTIFIQYGWASYDKVKDLLVQMGYFAYILGKIPEYLYDKTDNWITIKRRGDNMFNPVIERGITINEIINTRNYSFNNKSNTFYPLIKNRMLSISPIGEQIQQFNNMIALRLTKNEEIERRERRQSKFF